MAITQVVQLSQNQHVEHQRHADKVDLCVSPLLTFMYSLLVRAEDFPLSIGI